MPEQTERPSDVGGRGLPARLVQLLEEIQKESPAGLHAMAAVRAEMRSLQSAVTVAIDAMAQSMRDPDDDAARDLVQRMLTSVRFFLKTESIPDDLLAEMHAEAQRQARPRRPLPIETVLPEVAGRLDVGYAEGLHLHGLRGTWHRLWALMVLDAQMGAGAGEAIQVVLGQLSRALGRDLSSEEIQALRDDAQSAAEALPTL